MPYVANSKIHGLGVFADKDYSVGDTIELCPYLVSSENDIGDECVLHDYMFYSPYEGEDDLYCIPLGLAMIYNHSETPNAEWDVNEEDDNFIRFYALQVGVFSGYFEEFWHFTNLTFSFKNLRK